MRSSVSVILSSPPPDNTMSYPDYQAHPHHHRSLLVLVVQLGTRVKSRAFQQLFERISRVNQLKVSDSMGTQRPVWVTYRREYPVENNDWGDFQTHRRLLAIITIGQVASQSDLNEVCKQHENLKVKYASTIYDSRCIILGLNSDGSVHDGNANTAENNDKSGSVGEEEYTTNDNTSGVTDPAAKPSPTLGSDGCYIIQGDRDSGVYEHLAPEDRIVNGHVKRCDSSSQSDSGQSTGGVKNNGVSSSSSDSGSESTAEGCCITDTDASNKRDYCAQYDNSSDCSINSNLNDSSNFNNGNTNTNQETNTSNKAFNLNSTTDRDTLTPPTYFKTRAMFYPTSDHAVNIETTLHEFISSLFWVLESKRLDKSQEKLDRPPLLCAPFERKDLVGLDLDSRASRKRCVGRLKKQLGDLCLQVGLVGEAAQHYSQAADILRACNDWLWLAGCLEGSCAASSAQLYPELGRCLTGLQRNSSLGVGPTALRHRPTNSLPSNSLPAGLSPTAAKHLSKHCLTPDNLINKYREAIVHYSKYRNAGVVETEASIKAVYVLIEQRRYLLAAEFLSNVVFINLQLSDEEKIGRFRALAELYQELGMMRKAGFFRRVAAMRCAVAQTQRSHDWPQCYRLLLNTLPGYRLTLDPLHCVNGGGWGALQVQLIQEVVGTSRRMGAHEACSRHQAFLLAALLQHLSPAQRQEAALMLHTLTHQAAQAGDGAVLQGNSGSASLTAVGPTVAPHNLLPPVNLLNIPKCRSVKVMAPKEGRRLRKRAKTVLEENTGPFIFSPFASLNNASNKANNVFDFQWIEGDVCEVVLQFDNILTIPLQLSNIRLLTEGQSQLESWSSSVVLEAESTACAVTVRGQPTCAGELRVTGYSVTALGVTSSCRFKHLGHLKVAHYIVQVVPALPLLQVESENTPDERVTVEGDVGVGRIRGSIVAGETRQLRLTLHNIAPEPVTAVAVVVKSKMAAKAKVFKVDEAALEAQLPIPGNSSCSVSLALYGLADFLAMAYSGSEDGGSATGDSASPSSLTSKGASVALRDLHPAHRHSGGRSQSSILSSHSSGGSSGRSDRSGSNAVNKPAITSLEGEVEVWYSGQSEENWRMCHLDVRLQVTPTLQVIRWDVLPGDQPSMCYLVLDILNRSGSEMELTYTGDGRRILVQGGDECRVPVPVTRCPRGGGDRSVSDKQCGDRQYSDRQCGDRQYSDRQCGDRQYSDRQYSDRQYIDRQGSDRQYSDRTISDRQCSERTLSDILGAHVSSQVQLDWVLSPQDIKCSTSLPPLHFAQHTHHLMMLAPITWDVQVDGTSVRVGGECTGSVGHSVAVHVTLSNNSDGALPPLHLSINTLQDHQNGNTNYRTDGVVAAAGAMTALVPRLAVGDSFSKQVNLLFFTAGVYKLELRCCPTVVSSNNTAPSVTGTTSSITNVSAALHHSHHSSYHHHPAAPPTEVWTFAPSIELTISP